MENRLILVSKTSIVQFHSTSSTSTKTSRFLLPQWPTLIETIEIGSCRRDLLLATDRYSPMRMRCGTLDLTECFLPKTPALSVIPLRRRARVKEIPSHVSPTLLDDNTM